MPKILQSLLEWLKEKKHRHWDLLFVRHRLAASKFIVLDHENDTTAAAASESVQFVIE